MRLIKKFYSQGDDYSVSLSGKSKWHFGYSNDYPMQHGSGQTFQLPDKMVNSLVEERKELLEALSEMVRMYEEVEPAGGWQGVYEGAKYAIKNATE